MAIITTKDYFKDGDFVTKEKLNDIIDTAIDSKEKSDNALEIANKLRQPVDTTGADVVGTPSVEIGANGNFIFKNLKGQKGDKGEKGDMGSVQITTSFILQELSYGQSKVTRQEQKNFFSTFRGASYDSKLLYVIYYRDDDARHYYRLETYDASDDTAIFVNYDMSYRKRVLRAYLNDISDIDLYWDNTDYYDYYLHYLCIRMLDNDSGIFAEVTLVVPASKSTTFAHDTNLFYNLRNRFGTDVYIPASGMFMYTNEPDVAHAISRIRFSSDGKMYVMTLAEYSFTVAKVEEVFTISKPLHL